jgi:hypothetical protein
MNFDIWVFHFSIVSLFSLADLFSLAWRGIFLIFINEMRSLCRGRVLILIGFFYNLIFGVIKFGSSLRLFELSPSGFSSHSVTDSLLALSKVLYLPSFLFTTKSVLLTPQSMKPLIFAYQLTQIPNLYLPICSSTCYYCSLWAPS